MRGSGTTVIDNEADSASTKNPAKGRTGYCRCKYEGQQEEPAFDHDEPLISPVKTPAGEGTPLVMRFPLPERTETDTKAG